MFSRSTYEGLNATERVQYTLSHARELGVRCDKVGVAEFYYPQLGRSLRGAVALAPIHAGEELIMVPETAVLSEFAVRNSTLAPVLSTQHCEGSMCRDSTRTLFALTLLVIREAAREHSVWMPYIKASIEGHDASSLPLTWPRDSPLWRKHSTHLQALVRVQAARIRKHAAHTLPLLFAQHAIPMSEGLPCQRDRTASCSQPDLSEHYNVERIVRVFAVISARYWSLPMLGRYRPLLSPVGDLMNFGQMGIRVAFDNARRALIFKAIEGIGAGRELLFHYGDSCKESSMLTYGFAPKGAAPCTAAERSRKASAAKAAAAKAAAKKHRMGQPPGRAGSTLSRAG